MLSLVSQTGEFQRKLKTHFLTIIGIILGEISHAIDKTLRNSNTDQKTEQKEEMEMIDTTSKRQQE